MHTSTRHSKDSRSAEGGFTLIEVLVSLVILSIGLLGMAKLVMVGAHSNDSAYMRSQATTLAYEMLDTMRANSTGAAAGNYATALGVAAGTAPTPACNGAAVCSNAQLAVWDIYSWKQNLALALPGGTGSIATSAPNLPLTVTIKVQWDDSAGQLAFNAVASGTAAPMTITLDTVLQ